MNLLYYEIVTPVFFILTCILLVGTFLNDWHKYKTVQVMSAVIFLVEFFIATKEISLYFTMIFAMLVAIMSLVPLFRAYYFQQAVPDEPYIAPVPKDRVLEKRQPQIAPDLLSRPNDSGGTQQTKTVPELTEAAS